LLGIVAPARLKRLNLLTGRSEITVEGLRSRAFLRQLLLDGRNLLGIVAPARLKRLNLLTGRSEITVEGLRSRAFLR
jgi:hypothetical protein